MAIIATSNSTPQREPLQEGVYLARCYQMIHVGTNKETIQGTEKILNKVRIAWEFPTELHVFKEEMGEEPITISKEYTLSMHEKSTLRKDLKSWRGKDFTEEEAKAFDVTKLIGVPCMINVIHKKSKDGTRTYEEIASISPLMKGQAETMPKPFNLPTVLSYDDWKESIFESLPDFFKEKIMTSTEYKEMRAKQEADNTPADDPFASKEETEDSSDVPF